MDSRRFAAVVQAGATAPPTSLEFWMDHLQIEANRGKKKKELKEVVGGVGEREARSGVNWLSRKAAALRGRHQPGPWAPELCGPSVVARSAARPKQS